MTDSRFLLKGQTGPTPLMAQTGSVPSSQHLSPRRESSGVSAALVAKQRPELSKGANHCTLVCSALRNCWVWSSNQMQVLQVLLMILPSAW